MRDEAREIESVDAESGERKFRNLADYLDARPELGVGKMLANLALEPRDPLKPKARRPFRKGFVMAVFFLTALAGWFAWFNLIY